MYVLFDNIHVSQISAKIILCNYIVWSIVVSDKDVKSLLTIALRFRTRESYTIPKISKQDGCICTLTLCTTNPTTNNFSCVTKNYNFDKLKCIVMEVLYPQDIVVKINVGNMDGPNLYEVSLETKFNILLMVVHVSNYSNTRC